MRLLSWNVNGRVGDALGRQRNALLRREVDVVALQEVTLGSYPEWSAGLMEAGYSVVSSVDLAVLPYPPAPFPQEWFHSPPSKAPAKRRYFNLIAARHPMVALRGISFEDPEEARFSFPEKYAAVRIRLDGKTIDIHNAHVPPGSGNGLIKVHAFEAIRRRVDEDPSNPRVLCGDFNAPLAEDDSGPDVTAGHRAPGPKWPEAIETRWIEAEAALVENQDMRDVYRDVHENGEPFPASHFTGRKGNLTPRRYDHICASPELTTESCVYLSDYLESRLSDHAPVEAELALPGN